MKHLTQLLSWAERNERHLGAVLFFFGFITDLFTFAILSVSFVNVAFIGYLTLAALCTLGSHRYAGQRTHASARNRTFAVVFPLGAQYAIGSLLSGCLIFYTKSAALIVSWPFLFLLVLVFIGNEYFRTYYKHLAFQLVLLFFAMYAYTIFALPLALHKLGPWIFAGSTVLALVLFGFFLVLVSRLGRPGFEASLRYVVPGTLAVVFLMNISYFTGLIPPIPLTLPDAGIYQSLEKRGSDYVLTQEAPRAWWDPRTIVVHHTAGTPLYAFSSVSAPIAFDTSITHVWERFDIQNDQWEMRSNVTFPIAGGRAKGYRGYSEIAHPQSGDWRVTIQSVGGQVIGRLYFRVENVYTPPATTEVIK